MTMEPKNPSTVPESEELYTIQECAEKMKTSDTYARRVFEHEPGVMHLPGNRTNGKRRYHVLRVPRSVFERKMAEFASTQAVQCVAKTADAA
jgi:hypothetical protein